MQIYGYGCDLFKTSTPQQTIKQNLKRKVVWKELLVVGFLLHDIGELSVSLFVKQARKTFRHIDDSFGMEEMFCGCL